MPLAPIVDKPHEPESGTDPRLNTSSIQLYQYKVGSTLWAVIGTRLEVQFPKNIHSRYGWLPLRGDMETIDRVLDYLVGAWIGAG